MRVPRPLALGVATVLLASAAAACTTVREPGTIRVGLLIPVTGTQKGPGDDIRDGFQLYLDTHGGKLGGRKVELVIADEGEGPPTAVPSAVKLITQDKVQVLTGVVTTGACAAIVPVVNQNRIPFVGANGRPVIEDGSRIWHTSFLTEDFGGSLGPYMAQAIDGPVYAMAMDFPGGQQGVRGFIGSYTKAGGKLANPDDQPVFTPPTTKDYLPYLSKIKASGAKAVYGFFVAAQGIDFIRQYRQSEAADLPLYGAGLTEGGNAIGVLGDTALGVYSTFNYASNLDNPANRSFIADWDARHPGTVPSGLNVSSYDAGTVLDRALTAAGPDASSDQINDAISKLGKIDSPRGEWEFGPKTHTPVQKWYLRQVRKDGRSAANVVIQDLVTLGS